MRHSARASVVSVALLAAGCEVLLGISKHDAVDGTQPGADASADAASADAAPPCTLPSQGDAKLRFGDFVTSADRFDICVAGDRAPLVARGGGACPVGIGYKDVLAPAGVASGSYDVYAVAAGSGCDAPRVASQSGVAFVAGETTALYLFGAAAKDAKLLALRESRTTGLNSKLRFLHAMPGEGALDVGFAEAPVPPTKLLNTVFKGVTFSVPPAAGPSPLGPIDANGYAQFSLAGGRFVAGAARAGSVDAPLATEVRTQGSGTATLFALGSFADKRFPAELYACDERESDGIFTRCGGPARDFSAVLLNGYLYGPFAPLNPAREAPLVDAVTKIDADVVCVTDVSSDKDKQAIVDLAKTRSFPYGVTFVGDTLDTPIDDPSDQNGVVPPPPSTAPCAGALAPRLDAVVDCVKASCATRAGDEAATVMDSPIDCLSASCQSPITALLFGGPAAQRCWGCALSELTGAAAFSDTRAVCKNTAKTIYAWDGKSSTVLLSRRPLTGVTRSVLPSTDWRMSVIHAQTTAENGAELHVYCAELTSPATGATRPYTGSYGLGLSDVDAWRAELDLQIVKLAKFVAKSSGDARKKALVMADIYAGPSVAATSTLPALDGLNEAQFANASAAFPLAIPPGYAPECTQCANNPITTPPGSQPSGGNTWSSFVLLSNVPVTDVRSAGVVQKEPVIDRGTYKIPISVHYGFRSVIRLRP